jgi:AcrR family transcriptional regulator
LAEKTYWGGGYPARGRLEQAQRARAAILEAARHAFLESGYAATTIAAVAGEAGVSVETVYKAFGGKAGLVKAIYERALAGRGARPAPERSDAMSASSKDGRTIVREWGALTAEVSPLAAPVLLLLRSAAATDPELAPLLAEADQQRLTRMRHNAGVLAERGFLRRGVAVERAADIMWAYTSPELYEVFVLRRGWTPERLGEHIATVLEATLLEPQR